MYVIAPADSDAAAAIPIPLKSFPNNFPNNIIIYPDVRAARSMTLCYRLFVGAFRLETKVSNVERRRTSKRCFVFAVFLAKNRPAMESLSSKHGNPVYRRERKTRNRGKARQSRETIQEIARIVACSATSLPS